MQPAAERLLVKGEELQSFDWWVGAQGRPIRGLMAEHFSYFQRKG
jgi:hypothetical protein